MNTSGLGTLRVVGALIEASGLNMVTRRPMTSGSWPGAWEFPGGKREAGETFEACLVRELLEELGIEVALGQLFEEITHEYPERTVELKFFLCRLAKRQPQAIGCASFEWATREGLAKRKFTPAAESLLGR